MPCCEVFGCPSERNQSCGLMGRGANIYASRAASVTSKTDKKGRRTGPRIKNGLLLDTGSLLDIVEKTGTWITRRMTAKLRSAITCTCPVRTRTERATDNENCLSLSWFEDSKLPGGRVTVRITLARWTLNRFKFISSLAAHCIESHLQEGLHQFTGAKDQ